MAKRRGILLAIVTLALTVTICLTLYRVDNKYTASGPQPISGVLFLTQEDLDANPVAYFIREWEFYPNVLLTPQSAADWQGYRRFVDIGGRGNLTTGVATYRLSVMLPPEEQVYALELPEIYSSCRLYVNGTLLLQLGNPDTGQERISSRPLSFSAAGRLELLLAVSNTSGVYGGMTYPPAFGLTQAVLATRELRLLGHGFFALVGLLGAGLSLVFGCLGNRRRGTLHCLACLCLIGVTGYPLFHGLYITAFQPWYAVEGGCYYALLLLAVLLQCDLYGLWNRRTLLLAAPCALGVGCAILYFGGIIRSPFFSLLADGLKYYAAICLICLSAWALLRQTARSTPMLCACVALATTLVFDRALTLYEPIYGGWFGELGGTMLTVALTASLWLDALDAYRFRLSYRDEQLYLQQRLALQKEHYIQLTDQVEKARHSAHDLRHHLRLLRTMAEQEEPAQLLAYLDQYEPHIRTQTISTFSDHLPVDAVLQHYADAAVRLGATCDIRFPISNTLHLPEHEVCIILSNLLENAIEAMARQSAPPRRLYLRGSISDGRLGLVVDNSFDGDFRQKEGRFFSAKREGFGLGLASVQTIAEKHGGLVDFSAQENTFHACVMIPLPKPSAVAETC